MDTVLQCSPTVLELDIATQLSSAIHCTPLWFLQVLKSNYSGTENVVVTESSGDLHCQYVCHVALSNFHGESSLQVYMYNLPHSPQSRLFPFNLIYSKLKEKFRVSIAS